jgi:PHP family Zn ribbon phosphoesterase
VAHHPDWLQKYTSKFERRQSEMLMEEEENNRANFLSILSTFKLEEALHPHLNAYYKGTLAIHQNVL